MKQNVNFSTFQTAFENLRPNNFSYEGLTALFDYLEAYEEDTGEQIELDVIALCCDYSEMTELEIRSAYGLDDSDSSTAYLQHHTQVIGTTATTVIFQNF
jgi:hypothetical protein